RGRLVVERPEIGYEAGQLRSARADHRRQLIRVRLADDEPDRAGDGREGQRSVSQEDAAAHEDESSRTPGERRQLRDEPGLADAGLAGDERRGAPAPDDQLEAGIEVAELLGTADEDRTGDADRHAIHYRAR